MGKPSDTYLFFFDIEPVKKVSGKSKRGRSIFDEIRTVCKRITHIRSTCDWRTVGLVNHEYEYPHANTGETHGSRREQPDVGTRTRRPAIGTHSVAPRTA